MRRGSIDHRVRAVTGATDPEQENTVGRIGDAVRRENDQRAVQPRRQLRVLVSVGVIDERSGSLQRKRGARDSQRIGGRRGWSLLEDKAIARLVAVRMLFLGDKHSQTASGR